MMSEKLKVKSEKLRMPAAPAKGGKNQASVVGPLPEGGREPEATPAWRALRRGELSVSAGAGATHSTRVCRRHE